MCDVMDKAINTGIEKGLQQGLRLLLESVARGDAPIDIATRMAAGYGITSEADLRKRAVEMGIQLPE